MSLLLIQSLWLCNSALNPGRFCYRCNRNYYCCNFHGCSNAYCEEPCVSFELCSAFIQTQGAGGGVWLYIVLLHVHVQHRKSTIWKKKNDQKGKSESPDHILGLLTGNRFVQYISQSYVLCLNIDMHIGGIGGGGRLHIGCACCITSETTFFIRFSAYV